MANQLEQSEVYHDFLSRVVPRVRICDVAPTDLGTRESMPCHVARATVYLEVNNPNKPCEFRLCLCPFLRAVSEPHLSLHITTSIAVGIPASYLDTNSMSRIVRRQTPYQRISSYLNPLDHLLSLATDYEAFDWDNWQNTWGTPLGLLLNVFCMISRGHADKYRREANPVFGEPSAGRSMANGISYLVCHGSNAAGQMMACKPLLPLLDICHGGLCSFVTCVGTQLWVAQSALAVFSVGNAVYCFTRKRRYRLFESNIEVSRPSSLPFW